MKVTTYICDKCKKEVDYCQLIPITGKLIIGENCYIFDDVKGRVISLEVCFSCYNKFVDFIDSFICEE